MRRAGILAVVIALAPVAAVRSQQATTFDAFTVPLSRLPEGCARPASDSVAIGGGRVTGGLWTGLPMSTNPWRGNDARIVGAIVERVLGSPPLPDGPPISAQEAARFRSKLAEGVEEAYTAIYWDQERRVDVYALRFNQPLTSDVRTRATRLGGNVFTRDRTIVVVAGGGRCFGAVGDYVRNVTSAQIAIVEAPRPRAQSDSLPTLRQFQPPGACTVRGSGTTVGEILGENTQAILIYDYVRSEWRDMSVVIDYVQRILDAHPEGGRLQSSVYWSEGPRAEIVGAVQFRDGRESRIEFANGYVHIEDAAGCQWWGRYLGGDRSAWVVRQER